MRSYRPEELFDDDGRLVASLRALSPDGDRRMSANPHANGGAAAPAAGAAETSATTPSRSPPRAPRCTSRPGCSAQYLVDVIRDNPDNFRIFGPDETASNRLDAVYEVTDKVFAGRDPGPSTSISPTAAG